MSDSATAPFNNTTWGYVNATTFIMALILIVFDDGYHPTLTSGLLSERCHYQETHQVVYLGMVQLMLL